MKRICGLTKGNKMYCDEAPKSKNQFGNAAIDLQIKREDQEQRDEELITLRQQRREDVVTLFDHEELRNQVISLRKHGDGLRVEIHDLKLNKGQLNSEITTLRQFGQDNDDGYIAAHGGLQGQIQEARHTAQRAQGPLLQLIAYRARLRPQLAEAKSPTSKPTTSF
jgi:hypothetical protein